MVCLSPRRTPSSADDVWGESPTKEGEGGSGGA